MEASEDRDAAAPDARGKQDKNEDGTRAAITAVIIGGGPAGMIAALALVHTGDLNIRPGGSQRTCFHPQARMQT